MAEVNAFRGWRYDLSQVGSLSDVTAPPYDVISKEQQDYLYELHACNTVRLILNRDEPGDDNASTRYERASNFLKHWQSEGVLSQEREDALYVYHQIFKWEGIEYVRKGFLGRLRIEEFGKGKVYPHEQTMPGPKADRLELLKACRMNLSPVFGLYPDSNAGAQKPLEEAIKGITPLESTDELGVVHRFWPVTDPSAINEAREQLHDKSVFIADGHHRYETANNYRNLLQAEGKLENDSSAANFVLMHFVGMSDPGLTILPTHRLIGGLGDLSSDLLCEALKDHFEIEQMGTGDAAAQKTWEEIDLDGGQDVLGFAAAADGKWLLARLTDASPMASLASEQSDLWRSLGVSVLHKLVLDHLLNQKIPNADSTCRYVHLMNEVTSAMNEKSCDLACLVAPADIDHVKKIALNHEKMPPKSTYFYPKLLSGLVFNPLD